MAEGMSERAEAVGKATDVKPGTREAEMNTKEEQRLIVRSGGSVLSRTELVQCSEHG